MSSFCPLCFPFKNRCFARRVTHLPLLLVYLGKTCHNCYPKCRVEAIIVNPSLPQPLSLIKDDSSSRDPREKSQRTVKQEISAVQKSQHGKCRCQWTLQEALPEDTHLTNRSLWGGWSGSSLRSSTPHKRAFGFTEALWPEANWRSLLKGGNNGPVSLHVLKTRTSRLRAKEQETVCQSDKVVGDSGQVQTSKKAVQPLDDLNMENILCQLQLRAIP